WTISRAESLKKTAERARSKRFSSARQRPQAPSMAMAGMPQRGQKGGVMGASDVQQSGHTALFRRSSTGVPQRMQPTGKMKLSRESITRALGKAQRARLV